MNDSIVKMRQREPWADNAKFIGIALMVLGHNSLANQSLTDFIYSFHMPLFFMLSGYFASTKDERFLPYLQKNVRSLLVPYLTFCIVALPFFYYCLWNNRAIYPCLNKLDFFLKPLLGIALVKTTSFSYFIGPLWFFASLFIVKMMFYPLKKFLGKPIGIAVVILISISLHGLMQSIYSGIWPYRLNSSALLFPFYVLGYVMNRYTSIVEKMKHSSALSITAVVTSLFALTYFMSLLNGHVETSGGGYGNHLWLMYANALIGCIAVIGLSTRIRYNEHFLTIGRSTVVILGLHTNLQAVLMRIVTLSTGVSRFSWWSAILMTIIILAIHIPLINFINKYCPSIIGKNKKNE